MGLLDDINSGLGNAMASPLFNMGAGLLSARYTPYGNVGSGLLQGQQAYQQARASQLQNQMQQLQLSQFIAQQPALMQALKQWMGGDQSAAPQPQGQAPLNPPAQTFPLGSAPGAGTAQGQAPQQASAPQAPQAQPPQGLLSSQAPDPFALLQQGSHEAQFPMPGPIGDMIRKSGEAKIDQAKTLLANLPQFVTKRAVAGDQQTQDLAILDAARASGDKDRIDQATAKLQRDTLGGVPLVPVKGPDSALGATYARNPATGEVKEQIKAPETSQFVMPDGTVKMLSKAEGVSRGLTPFNPTLFGAANMSDQAIQMAADTYRTTGKMPAAFGRNPLMQARIFDRVAQDASATGDNATAIAARAAGRKANGMALDQVTKLETATTAYYNTLDKNLTQLEKLAGKVDSSGTPLLNKVYRAWQQGVSGSPDVAQYVTYLRSVESEFAKIQSGSLGNQGTSDASRREAQDVINKFMSQGQITAVAQAMRGEGNNRLSSIREQKQSLMDQLGTGAPGQKNAPQAKTVHWNDLK